MTNNNVKAFLTDVNRDGFHEVAEAILASGGKDAEHISYDNTESGLAGENVQAAIDEVAGDVGDLVTAVNGISGDVDDLETAVGGISDDVSDLQTAVAGKVSKSGDTMTGKLTIENNLDVEGDINTQLVSTIGMQFVNALGGNIILTGHPTAAGSSTVEVRDQNGIMALLSDVNVKVSKSGDTMSGNLTVDRQNGTTLATAWSAVVLGNNKPSGTDKNSFGVVRLYGEKQAFTDIYAPNTQTSNRDITFPDKNGTVALTSDITPSSWDTYTVGTRALYVRKIGGMVEMYFWTDETLAATTTICTLADKYKPSLPTYPNLFVVHDYLSNDDLEIYKDGKIKTVSSPKSGWKVFHATWGV